MEALHVIEIKRIGNGEFQAFVDGAATAWTIVNGSLGVSGRDLKNKYAIVYPSGKAVLVGPLASAKALLTQKLKGLALEGR